MLSVSRCDEGDGPIIGGKGDGVFTWRMNGSKNALLRYENDLITSVRIVIIKSVTN